MVGNTGQILLLTELEEQNTQIRRQLEETRQELIELKQAYRDLAFENEWVQLLLSDEGTQRAHATVAEIGELGIRELQHAYRLTKDRKRLQRFADNILAKFNRGNLTPHHPESVRAELEVETARVRDKGKINGVHLGWEWNGNEFWTEADAKKARQDHIETIVAERSKSYTQ